MSIEMVSGLVWLGAMIGWGFGLYCNQAHLQPRRPSEAPAKEEELREPESGVGDLFSGLDPDRSYIRPKEASGVHDVL